MKLTPSLEEFQSREEQELSQANVEEPKSDTRLTLWESPKERQLGQMLTYTHPFTHSS